MITYTQAEVFAAEYLENAGVTYKGTNMLRSYGFFDAPASKGHHLAVRGGLLIHSVLVTSRLLGISENMGSLLGFEEVPISGWDVARLREVLLLRGG